MDHCATCTCSIPLEPPVGAWMRDRFGAFTQRHETGWAPPGFIPGGKWSAMWKARGPYVKCGPWGATIEEGINE